MCRGDGKAFKVLGGMMLTNGFCGICTTLRQCYASQKLEALDVSMERMFCSGLKEGSQGPSTCLMSAVL